MLEISGSKIYNRWFIDTQRKICVNCDSVTTESEMCSAFVVQNGVRQISIVDKD